jgi:quercetin dioxygenase-like cupin family protein
MMKARRGTHGIDGVLPNGRRVQVKSKKAGAHTDSQTYVPVSAKTLERADDLLIVFVDQKTCAAKRVIGPVPVISLKPRANGRCHINDILKRHPGADWHADASSAHPEGHQMTATDTELDRAATARTAPQIVRYGELIPCRTAFIDAHTPGSDRKENFTIIGGGVSESADQHVHIRETPGFNIGAAGQPPYCRNSLHSHRTAEVFYVLHGRWRFFWGRRGTAGEVVLEAGDIFDIPTGIFRGFENVGQDYGMIMAILGGDDAGGGVIWAPQVIEDAADHGLILGQNGKLYDSKAGQSLPEGVAPMPLLTDAELEAFPEPSPMEVVGGYVRRYHDMVALAARRPVAVIGERGLVRDRPGFEVALVTRASATETPHRHDRASVLMPVRGHWRLSWDGGEETLAPGDTALVPADLDHAAWPAMSGEAALYHVVGTDDAPGPTWKAA